MASFVLVVGARPNFVKAAPILRELDGRATCDLVHTGQHYDFAMSGLFLEQLGIREPDVHLQVGSCSHGVQTGKIMIAFDEYLAARREPPRAVIVVGDVNSTLACALVASKREIDVVHVEAGLRSFDRSMPEEINRIVTDTLSTRLLVSEPAGMENLAREHIAPERIRYVGNVMIDTLVDQLGAARESRILDRWKLESRGYAVVTIHRACNVDARARLEALVTVIENVSQMIPVVFPVHPRTHERLCGYELMPRLTAAPGVHMSGPLGYREFLGLVDAAKVVLTDSGGIQEETSFLGVPCVTLRTTTERPVTLTSGTNVLVGDDSERALAVVRDAVTGEAGPPRAIPGWDGHAARRIVDAVLEVV
jgi:UDP-N-acetylglucosamine 2-epimerase (non-hydrolysing)